MAIAALGAALGKLAKMIKGDIAEPQRDLLGTCHTGSLPFLQNLDEVARLSERGMGAGVEPREAAPQDLNKQLATLHIHPIDISNLELAAGRWFERRGNSNHIIVVEVEARHGNVGLGPRGLLFDRQGPPSAVEFDDTIVLRRLHDVAENRRP